MEKKRFLECAIIINTHGVRGNVKLESLCDSPEVLADLPRFFVKERNSFHEIKVLHASIFKSFVIADLEGINDMDSAAAMKGTTLYAAREDFELEDGDYFIADLIGLDVLDIDDGKKYGIVSNVINRGSSDIYVVKTDIGERMMPAVEEFVKKVDVDGGAIYVKPIAGLLTDD